MPDIGKASEDGDESVSNISPVGKAIKDQRKDDGGNIVQLMTLKKQWLRVKLTTLTKQHCPESMTLKDSRIAEAQAIKSYSECW